RRPPDLGVLLGPARLRRDVRLDGHLAHRHEGPAGVEQQGADALRADVEREQVIRGAGTDGGGPPRAYGAASGGARSVTSAATGRPATPGSGPGSDRPRGGPPAAAWWRRPRAPRAAPGA